MSASIPSVKGLRTNIPTSSNSAAPISSTSTVDRQSSSNPSSPKRTSVRDAYIPAAKPSRIAPNATGRVGGMVGLPSSKRSGNGSGPTSGAASGAPGSPKAAKDAHDTNMTFNVVSTAATSLSRMTSGINSSSNSHPPAGLQSLRGRDEAFKYKKEAERWQDQYQKASLEHQKTVAQYEERLHKLDSLLQKAMKEKTALSSMAISKDKELSDLSRRQTLLKANLEKSEKSTMFLHEKVLRSSTLEKKVVDLEKQSGRIRHIAERRSATLDKLVRERGDFRSYIEDLHQQLNEAMIEREELLEAAQASTTSPEVESRVKELEGILASTEERLKGAEQKLLQRDDTIRKLEINLSQRDRSLAELEDKIASLTTERQNALAQIQALREETEERESDIIMLSGQLERMSQEWAKTVSDLENLRAEYEARLSSAHQRLRELEAQRDEIMKERDDLALANLNAKQTNGDILATLTTVRAENENVKGELKAVKEKSARDAFEYQEVILALKAAAERVQLEREKEEMAREKLKEVMEKKVEDVKRTLQEQGMESAASAAAQVENSWKTKLLNLEEKSSQQIQDLQRTIMDLTRMNEDLAHDVEVSRDDLQTERSRLARLQQRCADLEDTIHKERRRLEETELCGSEAIEALRKAVSAESKKLEETKELLKAEQQAREDDQREAMKAQRIEAARWESELKRVQGLATEKNDQLESDKREMSRQMMALEKELDAQKKLRELRDLEKAELASHLEETKSNLNMLNEHAEETRIALEAALATEQAANRELGDHLEAEREANRLASEQFKERARAEIERMRQAHGAEISSMQSRLDAMRMDLSRRIEGGIEIEKNHGEEVERMKAEISKLNILNAEIEERRRQGDVEVDNATKLMTGLMATNSGLEVQIGELSETIHALEGKFSEEQKAKEQAEMENMNLHKTLSQLKVESEQKCKDLQCEISRGEETNASLKAEMDKQCQEFANAKDILSSQLEDLEQELAAAIEERDHIANDMVSTVEAYDLERESLLTQISDLKETVEESRANVASLTANLGSSESSCRDLERNLATAKTEINGLRHSLEKMEEERNLTNSRVEEITELALSLQLENDQITATVEDIRLQRQRDHTKHHEEVEMMAGTLIKIGIDYHTLSEAYTQYKDSMMHKEIDLMFKLDAALAKGSKFEQSFLETEQSFLDAMKELENFEEKCRGFETALGQERDERKKEQELSLQALQSARVEAERALNEVRDRLEKEILEREGLEKDVQSLDTMLCDTKSLLEKARQDSKLRIELLERERDQAIASDEKNCRDLEEERMKNESLAGQLADARSKASALESQLQSKSAEAIRLEESLFEESQARQSEIRDLTARIKRLTEEHASEKYTLTEDLVNTRSEVAKLGSKNDELSLSLDALRQEAELERAKVADLESANEALQCEVSAVKKRASGLESELEAANTRVANAETRLAEREESFTKYADDLKQNVSLLVRAVQESRSDLLEREKVIAELTSRVEEDGIRSQQVRSKYEDAISRERLDHQVNIETLKLELDRANRSTKEAVERIRSLEKKVEGANVDAERAKQEMSRRVHLETERIREELRREVEEERSEAEKLSRQAKDMIESIRAQSEQDVMEAKQRADAIVASSEMELGAAQQEICRLESLLAESEHQREEVEEKLTGQVKYLSENYAGVYNDLKKMSMITADLVGHQNKHQRIKRFHTLLEDKQKIDRELTKIRNERDMLKKRNIQLERDLEAFTAVPPGQLGAAAAQKAASARLAAVPSEPRLSIASFNPNSSFTLPPPSTSSNATSIVAKQRVSRVKRVALANKMLNESTQRSIPSYGDLSFDSTLKVITVSGDEASGHGEENAKPSNNSTSFFLEL
ncbi:hypothetical protein HDU97_006841 [Phlyctochytrium planicorne]|nr:hypothetical protein HDU97_006841 [Phlyctochytrium planicorne]